MSRRVIPTLELLHRGAGVAIPLFSLRSHSSMGVGDFMDLKLMVDWAVATGQRMIQLLPINDTTMSHTWEDSYPYNANSIFALHPQYISLKRVGTLQDETMQHEMEEDGRRLNELDVVDYVAVNTFKDRYMRQLYAEQGHATLASKEFKKFVKDNGYWLRPYALYSLLRDKYATIDFERWGDEAVYSEELCKRYTSARSRHYKDIAYYYYMQYNLHIQLLEARDYARSKGVGFKGDIPIGVSRTSVDVWCSPQLFNLKQQAGAPPDDFSVLGQNWGFPTYNWRVMARDGYAWWVARFRKMAEYFDAYRIDHILGFFRIWEIPLSARHGLLGHFSPALPYSVEEIERYGFVFDRSYLIPDINDWILEEFFGEEAQRVKSLYFNREGDKYTFKQRYNTQIKILSHVEAGDVQDALMMLFSEVLFIEDPYKKGHYHPRISAQGSYKFRAMSDEDKRCYNALYDNFYYHRHNDFWKEEAMRKLPTLISSTQMLTCGEDLGMIPACVEEVMTELEILSLEIQRMPKVMGVAFGNTHTYKEMSVCTTSTHDMTPLRAWMLEDAELSQRYTREVLALDSWLPGCDPSPAICQMVVEKHLHSPAMWTILPLQDWLSVSEDLRCKDPLVERINIPARSRHYWRYRVHLSLEQLIASEEFNEHLKSLVVDSGR